MSVAIHVVDAFTAEPFAGNPAAVCLLESARDAGWMQSVAREVDLSETAFVVPRAAADEFDLRWFTPTTEVDLCGHATLASAHVLFEAGRVAAGSGIRFATRSGVLGARRDGRWTALDFPSEPAVAAAPAEGLVRALGVAPEFVGRCRLAWLFVLSSESAVRALAPDFGALARASELPVIVTALARERADFVSRFFAPTLGIDEDPVTGSAHCCLAPYWAGVLGRDRLLGFQCSARGGFVRVHVRGGRVELGGQAVTVLRGELVV